METVKVEVECPDGLESMLRGLVFQMRSISTSCYSPGGPPTVSLELESVRDRFWKHKISRAKLAKKLHKLAEDIENG